MVNWFNPVFFIYFIFITSLFSGYRIFNPGLAKYNKKNRFEIDHALLIAIFYLKRFYFAQWFLVTADAI